MCRENRQRSSESYLSDGPPCCFLRLGFLAIRKPLRSTVFVSWWPKAGRAGHSSGPQWALSSLQAKVTEECSQYEFENYMRQQLLLAEEKNTLHEAKNFLQKRQFGSVPPVRRLGHDAQPMNALDAAVLAQRYLRK